MRMRERDKNLSFGMLLYKWWKAFYELQFNCNIKVVILDPFITLSSFSFFQSLYPSQTSIGLWHACMPKYWDVKNQIITGS